MLVIATFAVASMVSAYASASSIATPRTFALVIADDVSQNALSTFIGAFIFSIVALIAVKNGYYGKAGHFALFVLTLFVFAAVIFTFVRWVDRIARLGRLGTTIESVEAATAAALRRRRRTPHLRGVAAGPSADGESGRSTAEIDRLRAARGRQRAAGARRKRSRTAHRRRGAAGSLCGAGPRAGARDGRLGRSLATRRRRHRDGHS